MNQRPFRIWILAYLLLPILTTNTYASIDLLTDKGIAILNIERGDRCLVSGLLLDENGIAFIYRGRRVTLHRDATGVFLNEPDRYFSSLQPRGALFQESGAWSLELSWLLVGIWMTLGLACGAAGSHIALRKGRSPGFWFSAGVALNIVALATLLTRPSTSSETLPPHWGKIPTTTTPVSCPSCDSTNHPSALSCLACGASLSPAHESEVQRT